MRQVCGLVWTGRVRKTPGSTQLSTAGFTHMCTPFKTMQNKTTIKTGKCNLLATVCTHDLISGACPIWQ